jgi:hypothetical protein
VRWGVARNIVWAWILTIPASATLAALAAFLVKAGPLPVLLVVILTGIAALVLVARRTQRERSIGEITSRP